ncbi:Protein of unknown function [Pseudobutyrivibrio sp. YE44]|uniref:DUF975 family protein n=1 Tax=Pseudobutyrivibrio sp. YE44 TaxID=1520802 RepID=UPI000885F718|nr:DUF975 family protein [Pseudobutyrivibrio sp. YE44]SDB51659.1 Protein of unknown function [Pseudobutyrivibrio sp. YE44]
MWTIGEIKTRGKAAFKANYWKSVLVAFILSIFTAGGSAASQATNSDDATSEAAGVLSGLSPEQQLTILGILMGFVGIALVISILVRIFLTNPIQVGCYRFFKKNVEEGDAEVGTIKEGFGGYGHTFVTLFLRDLFLGLWFLLLFIPGIVKTYSYKMVPYIIKDYPELSATEVITKSRQMMNGNKGRAFLLDLSFIGWIFLGIITLGIVFVFWTGPYMSNTDAALYLELKNNQ